MPVCSRGNRKFRSEEGDLLPVVSRGLHLTGLGDMWQNRWWLFRSETVHGFICSCYTRALWPLRMWPCTSPGRNGVFLMRLRYSCTWMSCWRTLRLYACWVRPAHPPLSSEPGSFSFPPRTALYSSHHCFLQVLSYVLWLVCLWRVHPYSLVQNTCSPKLQLRIQGQWSFCFVFNFIELLLIYNFDSCCTLDSASYPF